MSNHKVHRINTMPPSRGNMPVHKNDWHQESSKRFKWLAGAAATIALLGVANKLTSDQDKNIHKNHAAVENSNLESLNRGEIPNQAANQVVVFREGAAIRKTPTGGDEVAFKIKDGEVLRVDRPRIVNIDGEDWLTFTDLDKGNPDGGAQDPKRTYWANLTAMQNFKDKNLVDIYDYSPAVYSLAGQQNQLLDVHIDGSNHAVAYIGKGAINIGTMTHMPAGVFEQEASNENLKLAS